MRTEFYGEMFWKAANWRCDDNTKIDLKYINYDSSDGMIASYVNKV
jgi:hypothetical protein